VLSHRPFLVQVVMVAVVVAVRVFVLQRHVFMGVRLGQVQHDTRQHQDAIARHQPSGGSAPSKTARPPRQAPTIAARSEALPRFEGFGWRSGKPNFNRRASDDDH
jgi:uncharacterized membrane protein YcjF (UPF0283 family)